MYFSVTHCARIVLLCYFLLYICCVLFFGSFYFAVFWCNFHCWFTIHYNIYMDFLFKRLRQIQWGVSKWNRWKNSVRVREVKLWRRWRGDEAVFWPDLIVFLGHGRECVVFCRNKVSLVFRKQLLITHLQYLCPWSECPLYTIPCSSSNGLSVLT